MLRPCLCAALLTLPTTAFASGFRDDAQDRYEKQIILKAEFERATEVGGYSNPFTALLQLFAGESREEDIQPPIADITQVPESALPGAD